MRVSQTEQRTGECSIGTNFIPRLFVKGRPALGCAPGAAGPGVTNGIGGCSTLRGVGAVMMSGPLISTGPVMTEGSGVAGVAAGVAAWKGMGVAKGCGLGREKRMIQTNR